MTGCGLVAFLIASAVVLKASPSQGIAPYDRHSTCRSNFRYRGHHDWMPFANDTSEGTWRMLLDQYDYQNVLGEFAFPAGVWTARDIDGDGRQVFLCNKFIKSMPVQQPINVNIFILL